MPILTERSSEEEKIKFWKVKQLCWHWPYKWLETMDKLDQKTHLSLWLRWTVIRRNAIDDVQSWLDFDQDLSVIHEYMYMITDDGRVLLYTNKSSGG